MRQNGLRRQLSAFLCLSLLAIQSLVPASAQVTRRPALQSSTSRPNIKLIVGIVIDQFRADGLRRFLNSGAVFANAHYPYTPTYTACGHAAFMSGATPSMNGIVGNEWYERETGKRVTSVSDASVKLLGGKDDSGGASPIKLMGTTLGDEMRFATQGQAKVVGVSFKDRSAILPAGKRPNGAYWFSATVGAFVSSTYYFNEMPAWAQKFNRESRPDRYFGKKWERLLPAEAYSRSQPDNSPYEK
jgi:hypothetical protein